MAANVEAMEGIWSRLPHDIIGLIFSFLTRKEAAQTILLSKACLNAWLTSPTLDFDDNYFYEGEEFLNHIRSPLARYQEQKIAIRTLKFKFIKWYRSLSEDAELASLVNSWINIAAENGVETLELGLVDNYLQSFHGYVGYNVKLQLHWNRICHELRRLHLHGVLLDDLLRGVEITDKFPKLEHLTIQSCNYIQRISISSSSLKILELLYRHGKLHHLQVSLAISNQSHWRCNLNNVRRLHLDRLQLDDVMLHRILSSCQMIEDLELTRCDGFQKIKVTNLLSLKNFNVCMFRAQSVEVEAPNLEFFTCLIDAMECQLNLIKSQNMKHLFLCGVEIRDTFFLDLEHKFPKLEHLKIESCPGVQKINISSPSLKILEMRYGFLGDLHDLLVDAPRIVSFKYKGGIVPHVSFTNIRRHWQSDLCLYRQEKFNTSWFLRLKKFLTRFNQSNISLEIQIPFLSCEGFNVEEIKDIHFPEEIQVDELRLVLHGTAVSYSLSVLSFTLETTYSLSNVSATLDGVFWSCRPKRIQHTTSGYFSEFMMFLFHKFRSIRNKEKKDLLQIRFWEQDLKEVKVHEMLMRPFIHTGDKRWVPYTSDWETFLGMPPWETGARIISFDLDWKRS